jgi:hypothetical protein
MNDQSNNQPDPLQLHQKSMELYHEYFTNHRITLEQYQEELRKLMGKTENPFDIADELADEFNGEVESNA